MKKIKFIVASCLSFFLLWGSTIVVFAANESNLEEYEKVVTEVNQELVTNISIPYENELVINNIKQKTPSEFKESLLSSYSDAISTSSNIDYEAPITPSPRAYIQKRQEARPANNIYVYIDAGIETLGNNYRPVYVQVLNAGNYKLAGISYFSAYNGITWNSVGYETITVQYKGGMMSPEGLDLLVAKTVTVTYRAS